MIPLGDIDLRKEIKLNYETGVVNEQYERPRVRRIYSARIEGRNSNVTVAMYQGNGAEEVGYILLLYDTSGELLQEWRRDIAKYMTVRQVLASHSLHTSLLNDTLSHPNIIQIRGAASSGNIHATLFHDGAPSMRLTILDIDT
jgi:hypothetical protein